MRFQVTGTPAATSIDASSSELGSFLVVLQDGSWTKMVKLDLRLSWGTLTIRASQPRHPFDLGTIAGGEIGITQIYTVSDYFSYEFV